MTRLAFVCLFLFLLVSPAQTPPSPSATPAQPAAEPSDLQVELRTATKSNRFQVGEEIPLELLISSSTPNRYLVPCELFINRDFGYLQCPFFSQWTFTITPGTGWVDYEKLFFGGVARSGPSFPVPRRDLTAQPETIAYRLTDRFRFDTPGRYQLRFELQIGLDDGSTPPGAGERTSPHSVTVTRTLPLDIIPADPARQKQIIRDGEQVYSKGRPPETNPPSPDLQHHTEATRALCILGTPEAARVLARALAQNHQEARTCLRRTRDIPAAIAELRRLLVDPDIPVDGGFFQTLIELQNLEESLKSPLDASKWQALTDAERDALFAALPKKHGEAQLTSLVTVLAYPLRSNASGMDLGYDLPFPDPVIAAAAANFDRLPDNFRQQLLEDAWNRVRSPLMLPILRSRAEAGDGPALLRWLELDPSSATIFIRAEIVRPQPRFSSYYLRLPDRALPAQEQQIAANFITLSAQSNDQLVRSASLLHRYATRIVLPTVLPVIDEKFLDWSCSIQLPLLAYLVNVAPDEAAPRIEKLLAGAHRNQGCTSRTLTTLGALETSPVLERIALAQIKNATPNAADGAHYLEHYGSSSVSYVVADRTPPLKHEIWEQLTLWHQRFVSSGAEKRMASNAGTAEDRELREVLGALTDAYEKAQAWVLSPEDSKQLEALLGEETIKGLKCVFQCGGSLSVGPVPGDFAIYGHANEAWRHRQRAQEAMEYLDSTERLAYSINQYQCPDLNSLKQKLAQFPAGSSFSFAYYFTAHNRSEIVEISDFLLKHGDRVKNLNNWPFLEATAR